MTVAEDPTARHIASNAERSAERAHARIDRLLLVVVATLAASVTTLGTVLLRIATR